MKTKAKSLTSRKRPTQTPTRRRAKPTITRPKLPRRVRPIPPDALLLTQAQAAHVLQVSPSAIRRWTREGRLVASRLGRLPRYTRADIAAISRDGLPLKPPDPKAVERAATVRDIMDKLGGSER